MNMDTKPTEGFEKLQFLLGQNPFPPETFGNLLLLYCKYEYYHLAADVLAEKLLCRICTSVVFLKHFVKLFQSFTVPNLRYRELLYRKLP
mgnify:CR=1 FL=1